ncbi:MAG TPA: GNAT family N-acyltransferase [Coleofasciculaceae cyanobacterium]|jgi:predicted GNAT family N-acyltransferase
MSTLIKPKLNFSELIQIANTESVLKDVYQFRYSVYVEEMGKPYVNANHAEGMLCDDLDKHSTILYGEVDGNIVATLRISWGSNAETMSAFTETFSLTDFSEFPNSSFSFLSRFMIAPAWRRTSLTGTILRRSYHIMREAGYRFTFFHGARSVVPLFRHFGARAYKENFLDAESGLKQFPLVVVLEDLDYFDSVSSPLKADALQWENSSETSDWFRYKFGKKSIL